MNEIITARDGEERELLRLLDRVFYHNPIAPHFAWMLPRLYRPEYHPCPNNLVVRDPQDTNKFRAAVGLYFMELSAGEEKLIAAGLGNVAVDKKYRSEGYMKLLMNQANEFARERGADFVVLNGLRHRYQYFGFERAGSAFDFKITETSLRHSLRGKNIMPVTVEKLRQDDHESLAAIHALAQESQWHCVRANNPRAIWDHLRSWYAVPYVLRHGGKFAGYFIYARVGFRIEELRLVDPELIYSALPAMVAAITGGVRIRVLPTDYAQAAALDPLCENRCIRYTNCFHVLNFANVLQALLRLKARNVPLCEGELALRIDAWFGPQNLRIAVHSGEISVTPTENEPMLTLGHLSATRCFFAPQAPERAKLPAFAAAWFPLMFDMPYMDTV